MCGVNIMTEREWVGGCVFVCVCVGVWGWLGEEESGLFT